MKEMGKFLTGVLFILFAVVAYEFYLLTNIEPAPLPVEKQTPTIIVTQSPQISPKPPIFDPSDWKPWEPDKMGAYKNVKYGVIYRLQAKAEKVIGRNQIKASDKDGKIFTFSLSADVGYFSRREKPRQPPILSKVEPFALEKGETYLFEWLQSQNKSNTVNALEG